jgi:hypothetical protein
MTASTPGSFHIERVGRETVLPAKATTFEDQRKTEYIMMGLVEGKAGVAVGPDKNRSQRELSPEHCEGGISDQKAWILPYQVPRVKHGAGSGKP